MTDAHSPKDLQFTKEQAATLIDFINEREALAKWTNAQLVDALLEMPYGDDIEPLVMVICDRLEPGWEKRESDVISPEQRVIIDLILARCAP